MARRKSLNAGRPWLLGTDDNPPPLRVPWQMWSKSSDPHQAGLIAFEFTEEGLAVGWFPKGFTDKNIIPWHELAWMAGQQHPDLKTECEFIKEQAEAEGLSLGRKRAFEIVRLEAMKISNIADETNNPFLAKYSEALKVAISQIEKALV